MIACHRVWVEDSWRRYSWHSSSRLSASCRPRLLRDEELPHHSFLWLQHLPSCPHSHFIIRLVLAPPHRDSRYARLQRGSADSNEPVGSVREVHSVASSVHGTAALGHHSSAGEEQDASSKYVCVCVGVNWCDTESKDTRMLLLLWLLFMCVPLYW